MRYTLVIAVFIGIATWYFIANDTNKAKEKTISSKQKELNSSSNVAISTNASSSLLSTPALKLNDILKAINALETCHTTNTCPQDNSDPRASEFLRSTLLVNEIQKLQAFSNNDKALSKARELLTYKSGYVQEEALKILHNAEANSKNIKPILSMLKESYDAKIVKQALIELKRYPISSSYTRTFETVLKSGSIYASNELSKELLPFISEDNVEIYKGILQELNPNTKKAKNLKAVLFEFNMRNSAG